jgi:hypothetical protein
MAKLSAADKAAIKATADRLGLDPYSFGAILAKESSFRPNIWGGAGGNYYGLIQFGGPERREAGLDPEKIKNKSYTIPEQLPAVERWLRGRGFETGMSPQKAYATILGGNPNANINAPDANNTTVANTTASLLPGGDLYKYSQTVLVPFDGYNTDVNRVSDPVPPTDPATTTNTTPPTDPATTTNTTPPIYDPNASRFPGLPEGVAYAAYDPSKYKLVENKTKSLRDNFVNNLKNQLLMNVLQNPFGGLF